MTIGSLTRRKNGDTLLRLAEDLHTEGRPIELLITGRRHDADLVARYERLRRERRGLPMRLLGYVPDEELAELLSHSVAMLFPSRYEGFGIPVLEAMAAGAPVITSDAAALPEVTGDAGVKVSGDGQQSVAAALSRLANDLALRAALITKGRDRAAEFT